MTNKPLSNEYELYCEKKSKLRAVLAGNNNAVKKMRRIDIGWLNYCPETQQFKQVIKRRGGDTRSVSVSPLSTVGEVLEINAQMLFFPRRNSKLGPLEKFTTTAEHTLIKRQSKKKQLDCCMQRPALVCLGYTCAPERKKRSQ
jgi:hypothetical protein